MTVQVNDNAYTQAQLSGMSHNQLEAIWNSLAPATGGSGTMQGVGRGRDPNNNVGVNATQNMSAQQQQFLNELGSVQETTPSGFDSVMSTVLPAVTAIGLGAAFGPEAASALGVGGSAVGAGATTGAVVGGSGAGLTGQNVAKGALLGAAGGGLTAAAQPLVSSLATQTGIPSGIIGQVAKTGIGTVLGAGSQALSGNNNNMANSPGITNNLSNAAPMATTGGDSTLGGALNTGIGLGTTLLGTIGNMQNANAAGNVLSNAQAGTGIGTSYGYNGPTGQASYGNGQINTQLNGAFGGLNNNLGQFGQQQSGIANSFNGALPANVQNAINQQSSQNSMLPGGTQGILGQQVGAQQGTQASEFGLMNQGMNQLNNPLTGNLQQAAQTQLGTAGQAFNTTYNNSLSALNQQLALPTQQAEAEMANAQFGRGQTGTTGGALQTQAFATGLGQAYLGNQQTAYNEALNAQNSATTNAATLSNAGATNLNTANSLLANAYGQFNNTSQLNNNTANSIFGQNSTISQLGNQYGQQNVGNQVTAAQLPASLAGQYAQNANASVAGATGLNNIDLSGFQASLAAGTQQGNQYNNAISNAARIVAPSYGTTGGNGLSALGAGINSALGGGGSASDPFAGTSLANNSSAFNAYNAANGPTAGTDYLSGTQPISAGDPGANFDLSSYFNFAGP